MTWPTKTDFVDGDVLTATQVNNIGTNLNLADPTGITDGYVLTADGANSMGWEAIVVNSLTQLATGSLSGTAVNISGIPGTYKKIVVAGYGVDIPSGAGISVQINSDTSSLYTSISYRRFQNANSAYGYNAHPAMEIFFGGNGASTNGNFIIEIQNYASSANPTFVRFYATGSDNVGSRSAYGGGAGEYNSTSAVTTVNLKCSSTGFSGGTYYLYGVN